MRLSDTRRRELERALAAIAGETFSPRWPQPETLRLIRERTGIDVINFDVFGDGGAIFAPNDGCRRYDVTSKQVASSSLALSAHILDGNAGNTLTWFSHVVPANPCELACFIVNFSMGNGSPIPQPTGVFELSVGDTRIAELALVKESRIWESDNGLAGFYVTRVDATAFGMNFDLDEMLTRESTFVDGHLVVIVPKGLVSPGEPARLTLRYVGRVPTRQWCRVALGLRPLAVDTHLEAMRWTLSAPPRWSPEGYQLLFGDLHNHSGESIFLSDIPDGKGAAGPCGTGDRDSLMRFARDVAGLDFFCLSEHDWQMDARDWAHLRGLTEAYNSRKFITMHGFEWTSNTYGHRNVYFADTPGPLHFSRDPYTNQSARPADSPTPAELWAYLRGLELPSITVPHHMSAAQFPLDMARFHDPQFDTVVEIYSSWGDSLEHGRPVSMGAARIKELAHIHSLQRGVRSGFIASSDSHDGYPGLAQGRLPSRGHIFHHLGSGLAAVYVKEDGRAGLFEALTSKRSFAVTCSGFTVWATLDGQPMGSALSRRRLPNRPVYRLSIRSTVPLREAVIYRNGEPIEKLDLAGRTECDIDWRDDKPGAEAAQSYFTRVLRIDCETAWSSPVWIDHE